MQPDMFGWCQKTEGSKHKNYIYTPYVQPHQPTNSWPLDYEQGILSPRDTHLDFEPSWTCIRYSVIVEKIMSTQSNIAIVWLNNGTDHRHLNIRPINHILHVCVLMTNPNTSHWSVKTMSMILQYMRYNTLLLRTETLQKVSHQTGIWPNKWLAADIADIY